MGLLLVLISFWVLNSSYHGEWMLWVHRQLSGAPLFWAAITLLGVGWMPFALVGVLDRQGRLAPLLIAVSFAFGGLLTQLFKSVLSMPRPVKVFPEGTLNIIGSGGGGTGSMPSGHALAAFVMATMWVVLIRHQKFPSWTEYLAWGLASSIALSRVVVGAHWPADVLMGAGLGMLIAYGSAWVVQLGLARWPSTFSPTVTLWMITLMECLGAWMAFTSNEGLPMVAPFQQSIGAVALLSMGWRWLHMRQTVSS